MGFPGCRGALEGPQEARLPLRRADHRLRVHAGRRHGERPRQEMLPLLPGRTVKALLLLLVSLPAWAAYDANEIVLGATEKAVAAKFPSAHCKALEWTSGAADRRCDDAKILFGGVQARITFYLTQDRAQAFAVHDYCKY